MGRPAEFAPALGTGLAAFLLVAVIVTAGFMIRFGLAAAYRDSWRVIHAGVGLSLFAVIGIHALRNFGILQSARRWNAFFRGDMPANTSHAECND